MHTDERNIIKIRISGILDLKKISEEYMIDVDEIISFHNQHCELHELLLREIPKYNEYVYLPKSKVLENEKRKLKTNCLRLPQNVEYRNYGVSIHFLKNKINLHYKLSLKNENNVRILQKSQTYQNHKTLEKKIEQLAEKAESFLYPLILNLHHDGSIQKINNSSEILQRWEDGKNKVCDYYEGDIFEKILVKIDQSFSNLSAKQSSITKSLLYKLLFFPIYRSYPQFFSRDQVGLYFGSFRRFIEYDVIMILNEKLIDNKISLEIKGTEKGVSTQENKLGNLNLLYTLNQETQNIYSIEGSISAFENAIEDKITFALYELS